MARSVGIHEYTPLADTDRCAKCYLRDGDCPSSPSHTVGPEGHYLHSAATVEVVLTDSGSRVLVGEDDYYAAQGRADVAERNLAMLNALLWKHSRFPVDTITAAREFLAHAGYSEQDAASMRAVIEWARREGSK